MTTTAQALDALQQAAICYCGAFTSQPFATLRQHIESTADEIARLQAECEALRKDAEIGARWKADSSLEKWFPITDENMKALEKDAARYRWLRDVSTPPHNFYLSVPIEFDGVRYTPHEVDAAIDAALSTSTAPSGAEE